MSAVKNIAQYIWDLLYFLFGEGNWKLHDHERMVLDAAINTMPEHAQNFYNSQLKSTLFAQRTPKQVCRPRFYPVAYQRDLRFFDDEEFSEKVIDVQISVDGRKEIANVEFYKGRIESIQFKHPPKYYASKVITVIGVKPGKVGRTHADAIDRLEHGKNP